MVDSVGGVALSSYERARREERAAEVAAGWERSSHWVGGLRDYGLGVPAVRRLAEALRDIRDQRQAIGYQGGDYEVEQVAVRLVAQTLAEEIDTYATGVEGLDPHTIRWITAGLRCQSRPYCTGCPTCQTVTAPTRPNVDPPRPW